MSSGNPFGLSELSHFGSFQRVGGKAGGFINKKFFHPSSLRNQEKLWKAQTEDERLKKKQDELEKRRSEERQVEDLRKQMYLSGQGKATDFSAADKEAATKGMSKTQKSEVKDALYEQKRRMALLKKERKQRELAASPSPEEDEEDDEDDDAEGAGEGATGAASSARAAAARPLAKSKFKEDVKINGHDAVWGSWYSLEEQKWGFGCCKIMERSAECPNTPAEEDQAKAAAEVPKKGGKRKRGEDVAAAEAPKKGGSSTSAGDANAAESKRQDTGKAKTDGVSGLMDSRMFEAAARRKEQKRLEELAKAEAKKKKDGESGYLDALLQDPSAADKTESKS
eukprot:TRINITY_DN35451_c0_g1_i1.p1 TRINITY_DN35451_c0_g1~~TRINITY_DN35451_c0_g1_i1.p1  ORF type:complete len:339 (+),score=139.44 TRINITY_DN35451_c0_g1_i1:158-1174(+)